MKCQDFAECGNEADPNYTMDYTDVGPGKYIYWCSKCGPIWHTVETALTIQLRTEPGFAEKFKEELKKYERPIPN